MSFLFHSLKLNFIWFLFSLSLIYQMHFVGHLSELGFSYSPCNEIVEFLNHLNLFFCGSFSFSFFGLDFKRFQETLIWFMEEEVWVWWVWFHKLFMMVVAMSLGELYLFLSFFSHNFSAKKFFHVLITFFKSFWVFILLNWFLSYYCLQSYSQDTHA